MKRLIVILLLLLPALAYAQPSMKFVAESYDLGYVKQGVRLSYTFEFENVGNEDLVLGKLVPS